MTQTKAATTLPDYIQQPGPQGAPYASVPTGLVDLDFELPAGVSLDLSLAQEITVQGLAGGYFRIINVEMSQMHYVIPGLSPDDEHVAWYSATYTPAMPGIITNASIICGFNGEKPFLHCHGLLTDAEKITAMGHLLPETCIPSRPARAVGFGFKDARFNRAPDPQTGFELFMPEAVSPVRADDQGILLKIAPNIEISTPLIECCRNAGWERASVHGLGSMIGAHFADGRVMESFATEFSISKGWVDLSRATPACDLEIALVGLDGTFMHGLLKPQSNPVLITSEIILKNQTEDQ